MQFASIDELRAFRNQLLRESDAWFLPDFPLPIPLDLKMSEVLAYRIQLRNWPASVQDLSNATPPKHPFL